MKSFFGKLTALRITGYILSCCILLLSSASCRGSDNVSKNKVKTVKNEKTKVASAAEKKKKEKHKIIVYYFHGNFRCSSCIKIEKLTRFAVESGFKNELKTGLLEMKVINVEKPENKHFIKDYKLYTKSVIISDTRKGSEVRWKNADKVWQLLRNDEDFIKYIRKEVREYLNGKA